MSAGLGDAAVPRATSLLASATESCRPASPPPADDGYAECYPSYYDGADALGDSDEEDGEVANDKEARQSLGLCESRYLGPKGGGARLMHSRAPNAPVIGVPARGPPNAHHTHLHAALQASCRAGSRPGWTLRARQSTTSIWQGKGPELGAKRRCGVLRVSVPAWAAPGGGRGMGYGAAGRTRPGCRRVAAFPRHSPALCGMRLQRERAKEASREKQKVDTQLGQIRELMEQKGHAHTTAFERPGRSKGAQQQTEGPVAQKKRRI